MSILKSLQERYPFLPDDDLISAVEQGAAEALRTIFKRPARVAWFDNSLSMFLEGDQEMIEILPHNLTPHARRHLEWRIETELMRQNTVAEADHLRMFDHTIVTGEIQCIRDTGSMDVWITLDSGGLTVKHMLAFYPYKYQPIRERGRVQIGDKQKFLITSILPVKAPGGATSVKITLSRTSKDFPAQLLMEKQSVKVKSIARIPGYKTVLSPVGREVPKKKYIIEVVKELGERIILA